MNKLILLYLLTLTGCQNSTLTVGEVKLHRVSFLYPLKIQKAEMTTTGTNGIKNTIKLQGYVNDQAELIGAAVEGAVKGAIQSAK